MIDKDNCIVSRCLLSLDLGGNGAVQLLGSAIMVQSKAKREFTTWDEAESR